MLKIAFIYDPRGAGPPYPIISGIVSSYYECQDRVRKLCAEEQQCKCCELGVAVVTGAQAATLAGETDVPKGKVIDTGKLTWNPKTLELGMAYKDEVPP